MLRTVSAIISASTDLYLRDFKKYFPLALLLLLPQPFLTILGLSGIYLNKVTLIFNSFTNIIILVSLPILAVVYYWATLATIKTSYTSYHNQAYSWRLALGSTLKRIIPAGLTMLIILLLIFCGTLLLFIPGLIFLIWYAFSMNALIIDDKNFISALKASKQLVIGRFFEVAWRLLVPTIVFIALAYITQLGLEIIFGFFINSTAVQAIFENNLSALLNAFLVTPLTVIATTVLYEDIKAAPLPQLQK